MFMVLMKFVSSDISKSSPVERNHNFLSVKVKVQLFFSEQGGFICQLVLICGQEEVQFLILYTFSEHVFMRNDERFSFIVLGTAMLPPLHILALWMMFAVLLCSLPSSLAVAICNYFSHKVLLFLIGKIDR
uniref:Uncharacterized protein n=1 Tax=Parascaris equorum TaxID=6256 RepID=A0A914RM36_PAREQ